LASLPIALADSSTTYHNGQIILCGGGWGPYNRACWSYSPANNTWNPFLPGLQYYHHRTPSATYGNKFYLLSDDSQNEAFDFSLQRWFVILPRSA